MKDIIISNGHSKFILGPVASEVDQACRLACFITAGYPTSKLKLFIKLLRLDRFGSIKRLIGRQESISENRIRPLWSSELLAQIASMLNQIPGLMGISVKVNILSMKLYGILSSRLLQNYPSAKIYHYRSGYGYRSAVVAKCLGMIAVCDHSIAHPDLLEFLIKNNGNFPKKNDKNVTTKFWFYINEDLNNADEVIVNSDFVKKTFIHMGCIPSKIHVVYTGIDDQFIDAIPRRSYIVKNEPFKFIFAGELGLRKGAEFLIRAFEKINDQPWELEIIGNIEPIINKKYNIFLNDPRVKKIGFLSRQQLAEHMSKADVFIFPSLAEGSARVIFMAMACGCFVITTPNSGSIVEDGLHGFVVPAGDVNSLERSIRATLKLDRQEIYRIGGANAGLIREDYRQRQYGKSILSLYEKFLKNKNALNVQG
jgi:glycosyltransferase involved in cell wall biosynthesis